MNKNAKYLRIASVLLIIMGVLSVALVLGILNAPEYLTEVKANGETVLKDVALNYAIVALYVVAGIVGLVLANKRSVVTVAFGVAVVLVQLWVCHNTTSTGIASYVANVIFLLPGVLYFSAALRSYGGKND